MPHPTVPLAGSSVLVTGGCGFIGAHLARALATAGARRVVVLDRPEAVPSLPLPAEVELVRAELGDGDPGLLNALEGIDVVFHLAARKHAGRAESPSNVLRTNVLGTWELLEAAAAAGVRRVIFTSSLFAYGRTSGPPMREDEACAPATVYGISKLAGEQLVAQAGRELGIQGVILRYFFVYGPGQRRGLGYRSVIVKNAERLLQGQTATVYGDGTQALDYVYVDDVIAATLLAAERAPGGTVLNVGSGTAVTVDDLLDRLIDVAGVTAAKEHLPPDETAGTHRSADVARIRELLGWTPRVPLSDGLQRTVDWVRSSGT
jgi:nucleoside-diphosphate-sugar epimerase